MLNIKVVVTGLDNAQARLTKLGDTLHDFTAVLTTLREKLIMYYGNTVFTSEGAALTGTPWAPLKPATADYKDRQWPGRGILERSGVLKEGFEGEVTPFTLFITNPVPYFPFHQLGTGVGSESSTTRGLGSLARAFAIGGGGRGRNIPARPMIGINTEIETLVREEIETDVRAKIDSTKDV